MSFPVPFRRKSEIEEMAIDLLRRYQSWKGVALAPPINIDEIIEGFLQLSLEFENLKVRLSVPDVLGATWFEEKCIRIDSSLEKKEGRLSFTMAHEVGHWWMHRPIYEMEKVTLQLFPCAEGQTPTPAVVCRSIGKKPPVEWQADQFAAMLLMPSFLMRPSVKKLQPQGPLVVESLLKNSDDVTSNFNLRSVAKQVIEDAGFSNVSIDAMSYRLVDLNLVVDSSPSQRSLF
jgi:Zn-dependent peptidase ImmA (M78 family)